MALFPQLVSDKIIHWENYQKDKSADVWGSLERKVNIKLDTSIPKENVYFLIFEYRFRLLSREGVDIGNLETEEILFSYIAEYVLVVEYMPNETTISDLSNIIDKTYQMFVDYFNNRKDGNLIEVVIPAVVDLNDRLTSLYSDLRDSNLL